MERSECEEEKCGKKGEQEVTDEAISENTTVKLETKIITYRRRQYGST